MSDENQQEADLRHLGPFSPYGLVGSTVNVVVCTLGTLFFLGAAVVENDPNFLFFVPFTLVVQVVFVRVLVRARRRQRRGMK